MIPSCRTQLVSSIIKILIFGFILMNISIIRCRVELSFLVYERTYANFEIFFFLKKKTNFNYFIAKFKRIFKKLS